MSSNKHQEQASSLYLKEFFGRYFERKEMLQILSSFSNGLKVLEVVIQNFEHSQGIDYSYKNPQSHQSSTEYISDISNQAKSLSLTLENIYDRLRNIFDSCSLQKDKDVEVTFKSSRCSSNINEDDELYEMLNNYKNQLKREKQQRKKAEKDINRLTLQIQTIQEERRSLIGQLRQIQATLLMNTRKNEALESENVDLKEQISELQSKVQELLEVEVSFHELKADNEIISLKLAQSESRLKLLSEKFRSIDSIVLSKIKENQAKWREMIAQKLESSDIYKSPTCKVFRDFVRSLSKQNVPPKQLS